MGPFSNRCVEPILSTLAYSLKKIAASPLSHSVHLSGRAFRLSPKSCIPIWAASDESRPKDLHNPSFGTLVPKRVPSLTSSADLSCTSTDLQENGHSANRVNAVYSTAPIRAHLPLAPPTPLAARSELRTLLTQRVRAAAVQDGGVAGGARSVERAAENPHLFRPSCTQHSYRHRGSHGVSPVHIGDEPSAWRTGVAGCTVSRPLPIRPG